MNQSHGYICGLVRIPRGTALHQIKIENERVCSERHHKAGAPGRVKLGRRKIIRQIESLAGCCVDRDATVCLKKVIHHVAKKSSVSKKADCGLSLLRECLTVRSGLACDADKWLVAEAVVWGAVRCLPSHGTDEFTERLVDDLVQIGKAGLEDLVNGESCGTPFLLALGTLFPDIDDCQSFADAARKNLHFEVQEFVGDGGGIGITQSSEILLSVNRWVRCREIIHVTSGEALEEETTSKIDKAVRFSVLLLGNYGRPAKGCNFEVKPSVDSILRAASRGRKKVAATVLALTKGRDPTGDVRWTQKGLCECSLFDEEQKTAVFRSGWKRGATRVLVSYRNESPWLEIVAGGRLVVAGAWDISIRCHGRELQRLGTWKRTWWDANDTAVYLEMSIDLEGGRRLERSVLLLRKDNVVLLGDAVVVPKLKHGDESETLVAKTQLRSSLSVSPSISINPCEETREVIGVDGKPRFLAMPLALAEWRESHLGHGGLDVSGDRLELKQNAEAGRIYAPLWIDCNATRLKRLQKKPEYNQRTWRQLTVADARRTLRADQAASFRVQSCLDQWFVYRSLDEARNRTALGCNMSSEFLVGRIAGNGVVKRLLEVVEDRELY